MTTFYDLLGVTPDASRAQVVRAYRTQMRAVHPDTAGEAADPAAADALHKAHEVLSDAERRATYDQTLGGDAPAEALPQLAGAPVVRRPYWRAIVPAAVMAAAVAVQLAVPVLRAEIGVFGVVLWALGAGGAVAGFAGLRAPAAIVAALVTALYVGLDAPAGLLTWDRLLLDAPYLAYLFSAVAVASALRSRYLDRLAARTV
ncbi:J domain-containing protein [Cellulosimicrobium sp. Marseille-Q4280]|uniref:J domain-containing protein n=1 Tax=Cellulosimicrobium sp. Marseille-Q4280 TaxID=2937992 RepID=UPI0020411FB5|nr:J domain-containing protein [Cellulosimicrobium sp. Marseille-Q4280]